MVKIQNRKVERISVEEIIVHEHKLHLEDTAKISAIKELEHFIREIGSKHAYKLKGYVTMIRNLKSPPISNNLSLFIKSKSYIGLRRIVGHTIIKNHGNEYSSFQLQDHWKKIKQGLFSYYYYYSDANHVNVYTIAARDLPKYLNFNFSDEDKEIYKERLTNLS